MPTDRTDTDLIQTPGRPEMTRPMQWVIRSACSRGSRSSPPTSDAPCYRDGTPAQVGDFARGKTYNRGGWETAGLVYALDGPHCCLAFLQITDLPPQPPPGCEPWPKLLAGQMVLLRPDLSYGRIRADTDYGETAAFELLWRPGAPASST
jgi:hypothetical protein